MGYHYRRKQIASKDTHELKVDEARQVSDYRKDKGRRVHRGDLGGSLSPERYFLLKMLVALDGNLRVKARVDVRLGDQAALPS